MVFHSTDTGVATSDGLVMLGVDHLTTDLASRERVAAVVVDLPAALAELRRHADEALILSTCNRTELYLAGADVAPIAAWLIGGSGSGGSTLLARHGEDAAAHLFAVAAGVESQLLGETAILGQLRSAAALAREHGTLGPLLDGLLRRALALGRRARATTGISRGAASIGSAAASLVRQELLERRRPIEVRPGSSAPLDSRPRSAVAAAASTGVSTPVGPAPSRVSMPAEPALSRASTPAAAAPSRASTPAAAALSRASTPAEPARSRVFTSIEPAPPRLLVVGAGPAAARIVEHLRALRLGPIDVANRTRQRAERLVEPPGRALGLDELPGALAEADVAVCATGAPGFILTADVVSTALERRSRPLLILDLAVPRDVDPAVGELPGVDLRDLDAVQSAASAAQSARADEVATVRAMIADEVRTFSAWLTARAAGHRIARLRSTVEERWRAELDRACRGLDARERAAAERASRAVLLAMLHGPTVALRAGDAGVDGALLRGVAAGRRGQSVPALLGVSGDPA